MNPICTASFYCRGMNLFALALLIVPTGKIAKIAGIEFFWASQRRRTLIQRTPT